MAAVYDIVIIGAGPGGYVAAIRASQRGARVALIEKDRIGGTCLNRGCIPTKAMMRDAELFRDVASGQFCVDLPGPLAPNFARLMARKRAVVDGLVGGVAQLLSAHRVEVIAGSARLAGPSSVAVTTADEARTLEARAIILATGSVPARVPIPGTDLPGVVTSNELLEIERLPERLVVVGASVVGIEFACIFRALGAQVTVLGRRTFLNSVEPQLARRMQTLLAKRGMAITIGVEFQAIERSAAGGLAVRYARRGQEALAEGDLVLLSTGRAPYTEGLGLDEVGVATRGGAVVVGDYLETSVPGIYAIGDCTGRYYLAHVASYEAEVAVENILAADRGAGERRAADHRVVPNCVFTIPEIAGVGLSEEEAKAAGLDVRVTRFPFNVNGRALAMGEPEGLVRLLCERLPDGTGGRVVGVHILGPRASDLIAEAALAMRLGATAQDIAQTIHAHPTVPEALMEAAMGQSLGAIHYRQI
ncbi:MAG: dihydrolipoyl dehydrogenase [Chloroflexota bacterium]